MAREQEPYAWARGLGRRTLQFTLIIATVLVAIVVLLLARLGDTPPVNAAIYHDDSWGMDGLMIATVVMDPDCITVEADGRTYLPIFLSRSVRLEHDALLYEGRPYRTGDQIGLGGGEVDSVPSDARIPAGCPTDLLWRVSP